MVHDDATDRPSVQFLFATTNNRIFRHNQQVLDRAPDRLVINQLLDEALEAEQAEGVVSVVERGLSRSRNRALAMASGDICYICDDDIGLGAQATEQVQAAFALAPETDILLFSVQDPATGSLYQTPPGPWLPMVVRLMGACSVQVAFRRSRVAKSGVRFDERFGLGADFPSGEEAIFLVDCWRAGLTIGWTNASVAIHPLEHSGADYSNQELAVTKGAVLQRIFGKRRLAYYLPMALKSYRHYAPHMGLLSFLSALQRGAGQLGETE